MCLSFETSESGQKLVSWLRSAHSSGQFGESLDAKEDKSRNSKERLGYGGEREIVGMAGLRVGPGLPSKGLPVHPLFLVDRFCVGRSHLQSAKLFLPSCMQPVLARAS